MGDASEGFHFTVTRANADFRGMRRILVSRLLSLAAAAVFVSTAGASQVISTSTVTGLTMQLNAKGEALLTYKSNGRHVHVLAWGAENAVPTTEDAKQVAFQLDYSGGYQKYFLQNPRAQALSREYHKIKGTPGYLTSPVVKKLRALQLYADNYWKTAFHGGCGSYSGPEARVGHRRVHRERRQLLGRPGVAAQASRLRARGDEAG